MPKTDIPDGFIQVTITAKYPVYLSEAYGVDASMNDALITDRDNLDNEMIGIDDVLSWCDIESTEWEIVKNA